MTISTVKIQDKDSHKKLSVVQSKEDPTKWGVVILNPDGSAISPSGSFVRGPESSTDGDIPLFDGTDGHKIKDSGKKLSYFVDITNNQTVGGVKTFTDEPVLPAKSSAATSSTTAPATEKQVYDVAQGLSTLNSSAVKTTGNQSIGGTKTFTDEPVIPSKSALPTTPSNTSPATEGQVKSVKDAIPAVENVLTSTSTTNALSAAQGKALNDSIGTINGKIPSAASTTNLLADTNYVNDSINSITAYYITKNAQGDQFATYAQLSSATTFYSGGVVRVPTRNDYCIVLADENHDNACTRYIYQNNQWEYQYTVNETALTQAQLDALNSGITSGKVIQYDGYATGKQDALSTQTAYTSKGTSTKVATISTNNLGQVTAITETSIDFPVTSVNGSTGAVTVQATLESGTNIKTINGNSVLGSGDLTVSGLPTGGTEGQILMIVSGTPTWVTPTAKGFKMLSPNSPLTVPYDWYGTEAQYSSATKSSDTEYRTV